MFAASAVTYIWFFAQAAAVRRREAAPPEAEAVGIGSREIV
jgi:hypothetical protein